MHRSVKPTEGERAASEHPVAEDDACAEGSASASASSPALEVVNGGEGVGTPVVVPPVKPPFFGPHRMQGRDYDLAHLDPLSFEVVGAERTYTVALRFSCHCFTESLQEHHAVDLRYTHSGETRAFCIIRHKLSMELPRLFMTLGSQSVYNNKGGNFFFWRRQIATGKDEPYLIFFDAMRVNQIPGTSVLIEVNSAHLKPGMTLFASPVKFNTLIESKANGRKLKVGPAQQIKRK